MTCRKGALSTEWGVGPGPPAVPRRLAPRPESDR